MKKAMCSMSALILAVSASACGSREEAGNNVAVLNEANVAEENLMTANAAAAGTTAPSDPPTDATPSRPETSTPPRPPRADPPPVQTKPVPAPEPATDPHAGHDMNQMNSN